MEKKNKYNYFRIQRLDQNEESDSISNIYDLSILNKIKEIKAHKNNRIKRYFKNTNGTKNINQDKKKQIMQAIKKTILSLNFKYKWKLISFKQILIFFHIFLFTSSITSNIRYNILINNKTHTNNDFNDLNITLNSNNSNNNISNENSSYANIAYLDYSQNFKKRNNKAILFSIIFNQIILIPIWIIFIFKFMPKWDKINDILFKFTNYLLLCESYENNYYYYYLMKDFSIFITKKEYYNKNKKNLPISPFKNEIIAEKNIFLYCISIINDFILEEYTTLSYNQLIPRDDYNDIKILLNYIEINLHKKLKTFNKKIMIPLSLSILISLLYNKKSIEYIFFSLIILFFLLLICEFIFKEYIRIYKLDIDKFIDNFNNILIRKNRFIYRKKKLIMFLALKKNSYTKNQIIKNIEKIINS